MLSVQRSLFPAEARFNLLLPEDQKWGKEIPVPLIIYSVANVLLDALYVYFLILRTTF